MSMTDEDEAGLPATQGADPLRPRRASAVLGVPIEVLISVGKARPLVSDLVGLRRDSVLPLDSRIDDPVEIYIGDRLIARGELQEMEGEEGRLGVRLTEIEDLSNGL
jgi:flagellar motor switch protein FliN/FliY